ncbi:MULTISPECIES: helix-turn-helix domain-containing protein [Protofrankia]|uniref:DNA binding domain protein, excisionase family n=1 Tax=Candidatus Protofrankia datiscae TaxID=2716812 RepID=F8B106_9ACTN|nr:MULTISPECIES: helix-turn-helix domain-containing protein [Protofrankia]AEH07636.1 DNA binding domain protein, excisionase family [Candidatus Protofrankia datiscae]
MSADNKVVRLTYTVEEVAALLGVSRGVAYTMARTGEIPAVRAGERRWIIPRARFEAWLSGREAA